VSFKDFLKQQQTGMEAMANTGVIGLHLVSGPAVGFAIGYGLDYWLGTNPWCKLAFLFIGIAAGFLNVYRDTQALLRKIAAQDALRKGLEPQLHPQTPPPGQGKAKSRARSEEDDTQP
jgi:ATP synthase protein I